MPGTLRPQPAFEPTDENRQQVQLLKGFGLTLEQIALCIINPATGSPIDTNTLNKEFPNELLNGEALTNVQVVRNLFKIATGDSAQAVRAAIWWTQARMGWQATEKHEHTIDGSHGVLVAPADTTPEEWIAAQRKMNETRKPPSESAS